MSGLFVKCVQFNLKNEDTKIDKKDSQLHYRKLEINR